MTGAGGNAKTSRGAVLFIAAGIVLAAGVTAKVPPEADRTSDAATVRSAAMPLAAAADRVETLATTAETRVAPPAATAAPTPPLALIAPAQPSTATSAGPEGAPLAATCPATWFCFPRVGLAGPIVPYSDCSGGSDVGSAIRSFNCLGKGYLVGHAYTQFGLIRQWAVGDVVYAYGVRYIVSGAITQSACSAPVFPLAPLSLQTSLTGGACGQVLVVQAR